MSSNAIFNLPGITFNFCTIRLSVFNKFSFTKGYVGNYRDFFKQEKHLEMQGSLKTCGKFGLKEGKMNATQVSET